MGLHSIVILLLTITDRNPFIQKTYMKEIHDYIKVSVLGLSHTEHSL